MTCTVFATESDLAKIEKIDDVISVNICKENGDIYHLGFTIGFSWRKQEYAKKLKRLLTVLRMTLDSGHSYNNPSENDSDKIELSHKV